MIEVIATAESIAQSVQLLDADVDTLYIGEARFGLRLPTSFTRAEQRELVTLAHQKGKKVMVALNGIMHPEKMKEIPAYLAFLSELAVDQVTIGDPGVIFILQRDGYPLPYIYAGETLVTSARQMNFWGKRGAAGAILAREVPFEEMKMIAQTVQIPVEVLVYGATCIHHSKRPLLENYYRYTRNNEEKTKARDLFLAEPQKTDTHYSIYEDNHGTHIFADNDINLIEKVSTLVAHNYTTWKLDGLYTPGEAFVAIARLFVQAKQQILNGQWTAAQAQDFAEQIRQLHPVHRGLDTGFFEMDPKEIR